MRAISMILVVLVMLAMCTSSFGYILIYNVSTTVNAVNAVTLAKMRVGVKGYLVLKLNDSDGDISEANLIMYGKDSNTPIKQKVYVQLNRYDAADDLDAARWYIGDYIVADLRCNDPWDFEILFSGKMKLRDIGAGAANTKLVAGSLKGVNIVRAGILLGPADVEMSGTANVSATLWTARTKYVNANGWTLDEVVRTGKDLTQGHQDSLIEKLVNVQHYSAAVINE